MAGIKKGFILSLLGQITAAFFIFLFQTLSGRYLSVEEFGLLRILYDLILSFTAIINTGPRDVLIRNITYYEGKEDIKRIRFITKNVFIFFSLFLIIFLLIVLSFNSFFYRFLDNSRALLLFFITGTINLSLFYLLLAYSEAKRSFNYYSILNIIYGISLFSFIIFRYKFFFYSFVLSFSPLIPSIFCIFYIKKFKWLNINGEKEVVKNLNHQFFTLSLINFFDTFIFRAGSFIIKFTGGEYANKMAGEFNYVFAPLSVLRVVMIAFFVGFFPYLSKAIGEGNENLSKRYIRKGFLFIILVCSIFTLIFYFTGDIILKMLYGRESNVGKIDFLLISIFISLIVLGRMGNRVLLAQDRNIVSLFAMILSVISLFIIPFAFRKTNIILMTEITLIIGGFIYSGLQSLFIFLFNKKS